jgi:hypothetical protein
LDFAKQPSAGVCPVILGRARRDAEHFRRFIVGQANEVTQLHQLGFDFMFESKFVERVTDGEKLVVGWWRGCIRILKLYALLIAAMTHGALAASAINENATHRLGGGGEEVGAVLKLRLAVIAGQTQPCFVNERGRLQSVARRFIRHPVSGQSSKLFINQRQQFIGGFGIALLYAFQNVCDIAHTPQSNGKAAASNEKGSSTIRFSLPG